MPSGSFCRYAPHNYPRASALKGRIVRGMLVCFRGSQYTLGFLFLVPLKIHHPRKSNTPKEFPLHHWIWADPPPNPKIGYAKGFVLWGHGSLDEV